MMALTTVNGTFTEAGGDPKSGYVLFKLYTWSVSGGAYIVSAQDGVKAYLDASGGFVAQLEPTDTMTPANVYKVTLKSRVEGVWEDEDYDFIDVPSGGPYNIQNLIGVTNQQLPSTNKSAIAQEAADRQAADDLKLDKTVRSALSFHCDVGGTANAITLTNADVPNLAVGLRLRFIAASTNTADAVTVQVNGGGTFNLKLQNNGNPGTGTIKANWAYEVLWSGAPSNTFKLMGISDQYIHKAKNSYLVPSAVGGTADAITVTTDFDSVNGSLLIFKALSDNTSANVTLSVNGATATLIRDAVGQPLKVGDIKAGRWLMVRFDATGGNPYILISSGVTLGEVAAVQTAVDALTTRVIAVEAQVGSDGAFTAEALALTEKITGPSMGEAGWATSDRNPNNFFTWAEGVRTQASPLALKIMGVGSSIDTGAGPNDGGASAPARILRDAINDTFGFMHNVSASADIVAIGGQTVNQFLAQITSAPAGDYDIIIGCNNMNSGGIGGSAGAATMNSIYDDYIELIAEIRGANRNAMPIITNTFHPHTHVGSGGGAPQQFPDNYRVGWPDGNKTYQVGVNHTFDATANTIKLVAINTYGATLAVGDELTVPSGPAAGVYTISAIDWTTGVVTVNENISYTGTYSVQVTNTSVDEERVVWPPNSERLARVDRTGNGVPLLGWRTYDEQNRHIERACADAGAMFWDLQAKQYEYLEMAWASGNFTEANLMHSMFQADGTLSGPGTGVILYNHPNAAFYKFAPGGLSGQFTGLLRSGELHKNRKLN